MDNYVAAALLNGNILVIWAKGVRERDLPNDKAVTATLLNKTNGK